MHDWFNLKWKARPKAERLFWGWYLLLWAIINWSNLLCEYTDKFNEGWKRKMCFLSNNIFESWEMSTCYIYYVYIFSSIFDIFQFDICICPIYHLSVWMYIHTHPYVLEHKRHNSLIFKSMDYLDCQDLILPLISTSCVILGKLVNFSVSQFCL